MATEFEKLQKRVTKRSRRKEKRDSTLDGKLRVFPPIPLLQMMHYAEATGELRLDADGNAASVFFERGCITYAAIANRPMKLGEELVDHELIDKESLDLALEETGNGKRLGTVLLEREAVEEGALRDVIEEQIKQVIYEIVRWSEGRFSFEEGATPHDEDVFIDIPLDHLMLEGLRRLDEDE